MISLRLRDERVNCTQSPTQPPRSFRPKCLYGAILAMVGLMPNLVCGIADANTIRDLGFPQGITLRSDHLHASVFMPVTQGAIGGDLTLRFMAASTLGAGAALTVEANGTPVDTVPASDAGSPIRITIPASLVTGQSSFLRLTFIETLPPVRRGHCGGRSPASTWIRIAANTGFTPSGGKAGVGTAWRGLSTPVTIALPSQPSLADIDSALILSTALVERGITPFVSDQPDASIRIDPSNDPKHDVANVETGTDGQSQIVVGSPAAARALVVADQLTAGIRSAGVTATLASAATKRQGADAVTLGALGIASKTVTVFGTRTLPIPLVPASLPVNRHVTAVILEGRGAALPPGDAEAVTLLVGGNVVWSRAFRGAVRLDHVRIDLPQRLLSAGAPVTLQLSRLGHTEVCSQPAGVDFTLMNNTELVLGNGPRRPTRFNGFSPAGGGSVPVLTDLPAAALGPTLPLVAQLLGNHEVNPIAINVIAANGPPTRPFLLIADKPGDVVAQAPLPQTRAPHAARKLSLPGRSAAIELPHIRKLTVLQLAATKTGVPGLWLTPGPRSSLAQAVLPGDGNIAFYDGSGPPATFETAAYRADFHGSAVASVAGIVAAWRRELFAVIWLLIAVALVVILARRRHRR